MALQQDLDTLNKVLSIVESNLTSAVEALYGPSPTAAQGLGIDGVMPSRCALAVLGSAHERAEHCDSLSRRLVELIRGEDGGTKMAPQNAYAEGQRDV